MAYKSKEDIIKALEICSLGDRISETDRSCTECPYANYAYNHPEYKGTNCDEEMMKDILEYLRNEKDDPKEGMNDMEKVNKTEVSLRNLINRLNTNEKFLKAHPENKEMLERKNTEIKESIIQCILQNENNSVLDTIILK